MIPDTLHKPRPSVSLDTLFETEKLLQPYCNRSGTGAYAVDTLALMDPQNPCK